MTVAVFIIGLTLTGLSVWATRQIDTSTEQRLLTQQTKQAGDVLSAAIQLIEQPLTNALVSQPTTGAVNAPAFEKSISPSVGPQRLFAAASIWQRRSGQMVRIAAVGAGSAMPTSAPATQAFIRSTFTKSSFSVIAVSRDGQRRFVYALADRRSADVVVAERTLPADGRSPVDSNSAFADLHYAIYLGPRTDRAALSATDVDPRTLPFTGRRATIRVPLGDTVLTVVITARHHLGAFLSQWLPWVLLVVGLFLTTVVAATGRLLLRRRHEAEDSATYAVGMSERLQRALLPLAIPDIPHLEVAVDYVAGTRGVEVGGDWYSVVDLDSDDLFGFVVGDVSGRGIDAVAVMARARFTLRAYLLRGDSPEVALSMAGRQFDISTDGHMVTTIVGIGNWRTGEIAVANAGHCRPLLLSGKEARFVEIATGRPLGTGPASYTPTTFALAPGDTLFCYTDGLIERRTEDIDTGMERLAEAVAATAATSVADLVDNTVRSLRSEQADDDIAVLAFRWVPTS